MIVIQPHTCDISKSNPYTTNTYFENGILKKFYFRGAIAWPEGNKEGFALLAGQDLDTNLVIVFKQYPFWTIDNWLELDGNIRRREDGSGYYTGLMQFIQDNLAHFKCSSYFLGGQHIEYYKRFGKEVYNHPQASRRIELIEVPYVAENGPSVLLEKIKTHRFKGDVDSILHKSLESFTGTQTVNISYDSPTLAFMNLLVGFDRLPWVNINK